MKKRFVVLGLLLLCLGGKAQDAYCTVLENSGSPERISG